MENQVIEEPNFMLSIDTILNGRYKIMRHLYSRKHSYLYEAVDTKFREKVFIRELFVNSLFVRKTDGKTVDKTQIPEDIYSDYVTTFEEEARILRQHSNSHIATITDMFKENSTSYYVIKHFEGELLSEMVLRRNKPLTESTTMSYLIEILDGLSCLHSQGFWHLDPTPSSIMIDNEGHIKFFDFGHCKLVDTGITQIPSVTHDPEELVNHDITNIGPWTDLYILGATLYNLMTGKMPPLVSELNETTNKIYNFPSSVSKKMQRLILWMMTPNIFRRPQDVNEVSDYISGMQGTPNQPSALGAIDNTIVKSGNHEPGINNHDDENEDDDAGLSNKTLKAMQIFIFVAIFGIIAFLAYKYMFVDNDKINNKNELTIEREDNSDDLSLVDSLRTESDIIFPTLEEENKTEEKKDTTSKNQSINTELSNTEEKIDKQDNTQENSNETIKEDNKEKENNQQPNNSTNEKETKSEEKSQETTSSANTSIQPTQQEQPESTLKPKKIILGSFNNEENANNRMNEVKSSGFNAKIEKEGEYFKIIVPATNNEDANKKLEQLKTKYPDAWISK